MHFLSILIRFLIFINLVSRHRLHLSKQNYYKNNNGWQIVIKFCNSLHLAQRSNTTKIWELKYQILMSLNQNKMKMYGFLPSLLFGKTIFDQQGP